MAENEHVLTSGILTKHTKQNSLFEEVVKLYEEEADDDSILVKEQRAVRVMAVIKKAEKYGQPPQEVKDAVVSEGQGRCGEWGQGRCGEWGQGRCGKWRSRTLW
jgi:hypothetical protein